VNFIQAKFALGFFDWLVNEQIHIREFTNHQSRRIALVIRQLADCEQVRFLPG